MRKLMFTIGLCALFLAIGLIGGGNSQSWDRGAPEALLSRFLERGEGFQELLAKKPTITPLLRSRLEDERPEVRRRALEVLGQLDVQQDGVLNEDETIRDMVDTINGIEYDVAVINTALRYLQHIDPGKTTPTMIEGLLTQLDYGQAKAALVLGQTRNPALRPVLERYAGSPDIAIAERTKQALAKLGDEHYLAEILAQLDTDDGRVRSETFQKLVYVKNAGTVREIAQFLWNQDSAASASQHVKFVPYRFLAAWALGQMIDNPPVKKDLAALYTEQDVKTWQTWWKSHQHAYP